MRAFDVLTAPARAGERLLIGLPQAVDGALSVMDNVASAVEHLPAAVASLERTARHLERLTEEQGELTRLVGAARELAETDAARRRQELAAMEKPRIRR